LADYSLHHCADGSHIHLSVSEVTAREQTSVVVWLQRSQSRREKSIVQIHELPGRDTRWAGRPSASQIGGESLNSGLSFRVGEYLAKRIRQEQPWAIVMLSHITRRAEREPAISEQGHVF